MLLESCASRLVSVHATVETDPVPHRGDAADDIAIWIHPDNTALSTIIGTDKLGGFAVYDLHGNGLQYLSDGNMNNVDIRYGFPLGGAAIDLVGMTNRTTNSLAFYKVNPSTRKLTRVGSVSTSLVVYGFCMYKSPSSAKYYAFVNDKKGNVVQYEIHGNGRGHVTGTIARSFNVGSIVEGCVADDELAKFYIAEETVAIWKYGAEPGDGTTRTRVDAVGSRLKADIEGLTIYYGEGGTGYLIASSQGSNQFAVYKRQGDNAYIGNFQISAGSIDAVTGTDGIDVVGVPMGPSFPYGFFIAQDSANDTGNQNFKMIPWENVASAFSPNLPLIRNKTRSRH
jgi:3-phytase